MAHGFARLPKLAPVALLLALAGPGVAVGQSRHDTAAPIDFDAQHLELQDRANRAILSGGVVIRQGEMTLNAATVTVSYTGELAQGSPQVSRLDAAGGVRVTRPDQTATSEYGVYDVNRRVLTMVGGVTLQQGANRVTGGRLSIDLDSGRATLDGSGVGGVPGSVRQQGGRVTGRFSVPKRDR